MPVAAEGAYFIKLGHGGEWETESLEQGTLRLGYRETPHELCLLAHGARFGSFGPPDGEMPGRPPATRNKSAPFTRPMKRASSLHSPMVFFIGAGSAAR